MSVIATEKQINFITSLVEQKITSDLPPLMLDYIAGIEMGYPETINKITGSRMIELLLECPKKKVVKIDSPKVAGGRYAIKINDKMRFFEVNAPDKGRWAGYVFVNEQAGSELFPIRNNKQRADILNMLAKDSEALARYGQELGYCGMCNRELTDETSRAIGIGPVCRNK